MNTKGTKFLAVLAVLAMAFAAVAVFSSVDESDAVAGNVTTEEALATALTTAAGNPSVEYELTVTASFAITADKTIGSNVTIKVAASQTLTVNDGKTLTNKGTIEILADGIMTINGTIINDGTITNNGGVDNWMNGNVTLNGTARITTSGTEKGTINGTNEPLVLVLGGTLENQIIDSTGYTTPSGDLDQSIYVYHAAATISKNVFKIASGSSYALAVSAVADKKTTVTGNTFDANGGTIRKALCLSSDASGISVEITGNDFTGVSYNFAEGKDADLVLGVDDNAHGFSVGPAGSGANVIIDNTVRSIAPSAGADDVFTLSGALTFENLNLRSGAFLDVATGANITVTKDVVIIGTLDNDGTIIVPTAFIATKITDGAVKVAASEGSSEKTVTTDDGTATTTAAIEALFNDGAEVLILTGAVAESVTVPADKAVVIENGNSLEATDVITAKANGAQATITSTKVGGIAFKADVGFDKPVEISGFIGTATITKGSIVINGEDTGLTSGTFNLHDGDVAKISGLMGAVTFQMADGEATSASAKVIVEAGDDKKLTILDGTTMLIKAKINVEINGEVIGQDVTDSIIDVSAAKSVVINDGAVLKTVKIKNDAKAVTVYSGSDINAANFTGFNVIAGKDAASGTWSYNADTTILTLNNYNGTYNFKQISGLATKIVAVGDAIVTYAPVAASTLFAAATVVDSDEGSLTINVDVSKFDAATLTTAPGLKVFNGATFSLNQIDLTIAISGTNNDWTTDNVKAMKIAGIETAGLFKMYNASLDVDVMKAYKNDKPAAAIAVKAAGLDVVTSEFSIASAGYGIISTAVMEIKSSTGTISIDAPTAISAPNEPPAYYLLTIQKTEMEITGDVAVNMAISNESSVNINGKLTTGTFGIDKQSSVEIKNLTVSNGAGAIDFAVDKAATVTVTGTTVIAAGAKLSNAGTFTNSGTIFVYGTLETTDGTFTNSGTITGIAKTVAVGEAKTITMDGGEAAPAAGFAKIDTITVDAIAAGKINNDGSAKVTGSVTFVVLDGYAAAIADMTGTLVPSQVDGKYTLTLSGSGVTITANYDGTTMKAAAVVASGTVKATKADNPDRYLSIAANVADYGQTITANIADAASTIQVAGGVFNNDGTVTVYDGAYATGETAFVKTGATYNGPLAVGSETIAIDGTLKGDITSAGDVKIYGTLEGNITTTSATENSVIIAGTMKGGNVISKGKVTVNASKSITGDITTEGIVDVQGKITGNIYAKTTVTAKDITGNIEVTSVGGAATVVVTVWKMAGDLIYNSTYNTDAATPTPTTATETMKFTIASEAATGEAGVKINLVAGTNFVAPSTAGKAGYFQILNDSGSAAADKTVEIKLVAGKLDVTESLVLKARYALIIEEGTTLEISNKSAIIDSSVAALKVSDGATKNYEEGSAAPVNYGKVTYVMKYAVSGGYTVYSNLAYALQNSDEGSELTVGTSTNVTDSVEIGTGITVIVPKDVVLTFAGKDVKMKEGAKILLEDNGRVVFQPSGDNFTGVDPEDLPDTYQWYAVSGAVVFDDNTLTFDGVRFVTANAIIYGVAATESAASKFNATLQWNEGEIALDGNAIGSITLGQISRAVDKAGQTALEPVTTPFSAKLVIKNGATFEATAFSDSYGNVDYKADGSVNKVNAIASDITIDGKLVLATNAAFKGKVQGSGEVVLNANGRTLTLGAWYDFAGDAAQVAKNLAPVVNIKVVDATEAKNGYTIENVAALGNEAATIIFAATAANLVTVNGTMDAGTITALTTATLDTFVINKDATVVADAVKLINDSTSNGILKTKALDLNSKVLTYDTTYKDGDYTVYTAFANIDFDDVTNVTIEKANYVFAAGQVIKGDVTITIKDGVTATVNGKLIVGTAATTLGAAGPVIVGNISIPAAAYMIVYPDADISGAKILSQDKTTAATSSKFDIEGIEYATVYASKNAETTIFLDDPAADLVPEITGYTFTSWHTYNEFPLDDAKIGTVNVTASLVAQKVTVKATFVEGVQYYMNGMLYDAVGIDNKVAVGSIFTAKIVDYSKYQGTPLVNGQNAFEVTENVTLNVTGVSPVTPEPEPEPAPAGMSLTEILLIVLVVLIAIMVVIIALRLNRS